MRAWVKRHPLKKEHENSPGHVILSKPPKIEVSFEFKPGANPASRQLKMSRFPENPEPEWGPKARYDTEECGIISYHIISYHRSVWCGVAWCGVVW